MFIATVATAPHSHCYIMWLMCTIVCIQAGIGRGRGSINLLQSSSFCLFVCLSDLCVRQRARVRLVLRPPNFQESDHALSNYWYRYRSDQEVSVSEVSVNYGIGLALVVSMESWWYPDIKCENPVKIHISDFTRVAWPVLLVWVYSASQLVAL